MKFRDAYRQKNESIHVRESLLDEIKLAEENAERQKKSTRRPWLIAVPTAAAVAVAACLAVFVGLRGTNIARDSKSADAASFETAAPAAGMPMEAAYSEETDDIKTVASYDELAEIMASRANRGGRSYGVTDEAVPEAPVAAPEPNAVMAETASMPMGADNVKSGSLSTEGGVSYSGTNNQVAGIDEADIVKTDGSWIYALNQSDNKVYILSAEGKDSKIVGTIKLQQTPENATYWRYYQEMILAKDRLYLLGSYNDWSKENDGMTGQYAIAAVYDISDRTAPKEISTLKQQGSYRTARLIDDLLVIVSDYRIWYLYAIDESPVVYAPRVTMNGTEEKLKPDQIYVNPESKENGFTVVTTINALDGTEYDSYKAVLGGCDTVYCNGTDLLIASQEWESEQSEEQTNSEGKHFVSAAR